MKRERFKADFDNTKYIRNPIFIINPFICQAKIHLLQKKRSGILLNSEPKSQKEAILMRDSPAERQINKVALHSQRLEMKTTFCFAIRAITITP